MPVVFGTKFRRKILAGLPLLRDLLSSIVTEMGFAGMEYGAEPDHLHFHLRYPPTVNWSAAVGNLKTRSASAYLNCFGSFYSGRHSGTLWSAGFFLCSIGGAT